MEVALLVAILGCGGITFAYIWALLRGDARRTRRVLRRARITRIDELVDGQLACIVGTVELDGEPVLAKFSRALCVAYDAMIHWPSPLPVEVERRLVPFFVVGEGGRVRIDAAEAALCNRPIVSTDRAEERIVRAGDRVRLVGSVRIEPASGEADYRRTGVTATLTGSHKFPLLIDVEPGTIIPWARATTRVGRGTPTQT